MLDWLRRGGRTLAHLTRRPEQPVEGQEPPLSALFHRAAGTVFGHYRPGEGAVVFSPIQTGNRRSGATVAHEQVHQQLTANSTYGLFWQVLHRKLGEEHPVLIQAMRGQWGAQEGTATYVQLAHVALREPDALDAAVSLLPTRDLGQEPYREWFDLLDGLLPLEPPALERASERVEDQADFVLALGIHALNSSVLTSFRTPEDLTERGLESYLDREGPDVRLRTTVERLRATDALDGMFAVFQTLRRREREEGQTAQGSLASLTQLLASTDPLGGARDDADRLAQSEEFVRSWVPGAKCHVAGLR